MQRESLERDGEGPYHDSTTKSLLGDWVFHKIANEEALGPSHICGRERNEVRNYFGERRSWVVLKIGAIGLTNMKNRSNQSALTDREKLSRNRLSSPQEGFDDLGE
jgi:hypothetical protein